MQQHDIDTEPQQGEPIDATLETTTNAHINNSRPIRLSHVIDTLCRHIEFVLTGRMDVRSPSLREDGTSTTLPTTTTTTTTTTNIISQQQEDGPPPDDLFDHLLSELQLLAASADYYHNHKSR
jgi:hypothetical protein